jgi:hypothetical protein
MEGRAISLRLLPALVFAAAVLSIVAALDWPLAKPQPAALFGTSAYGGFVTGVELSSDADLVKAADDGELAFVFDGNNASRIPSAIGSYMAVEHQRGIVGVYAELTEGSASSYLKKVNKGNILGTAGASGWTKGSGLSFKLFDRAAGRWVNPLLLMPPLDDKAQPLIRSAALMRDGKLYPLGETKSLPQGQYTVVVDAVDSLQASWTAAAPAPYFLRVVVDGAKAGELSFDVAEQKGGKLMIGSQSPRSFNDCYLPDGKIILASRVFARGKSVIQILVRDYAGNERQASWALILE